MKYKYSYKRGFTLLEVLIVIGILAVLSAAVLVAVNPTRQFKIARDTQRLANVNAIANAISQNMSEHKGVFTCAEEVLADATVISKEGADIAPCLVPDYIAQLPVNPGVEGVQFISTENYNTGYEVSRNQTTGRITVSTVGELEAVIKAER